MKFKLVSATLLACVLFVFLSPAPETARAVDASAASVSEAPVPLVQRVSAAAASFLPAAGAKAASGPEGPATASEAEAIRIALARGAEIRAARAGAARPALKTVAMLTGQVPAPAADPAAPEDTVILAASGQPGWRVTASNVNLRAGPGTEHSVVGRAALDERLTPVSGTGGPWIEVERPDGSTAWIFARFLERAEG